MKIWFYKRDAEVGDLVYCDGTYSNFINKSKTVIGVCFYIDPNDKTHRLCVALEDLLSYPWGLSYSNWSGGITLASSPFYVVFNIPTLQDITVGTGLINEDSYRDIENGDSDGFVIPTQESALAELCWEELSEPLGQHQAGERLPKGLVNTLKIINHRNFILNDSNVNLAIPSKSESQTELQNLYLVMQHAVSSNGDQAKYREYYYPAASQCYSYEPKIKDGETLSGNFKAGNWFLPSAGELARLYWCNIYNKSQQPEINGIFARCIEIGILLPFGKFWYNSSTESNLTAIWGVLFSSGLLASIGYMYKQTDALCRAVCAF